MASSETSNNLPFVSVIIPCRNEEQFIGQCLDSILENDYPQDKLEILILDGMSEDGTRKIITEYIRQYPFIRLLDNEKRITPCALNIGIRNASGEIIIRMDAHATYEKDYISKCVKYLLESDADNVGGIWIIKPRNSTPIGRSIAYVLSSRFGAGNATYKTGAKEPKWVDTVFGGCYKRDVFEKVGLFNENFIRNQDLEFNIRLRKADGKILLVPEIVCYYYARAKLVPFFIHNIRDGVSVIYPYPAFRLRHLVPLVFVTSLIGSTALSLLFPLVLWLLGGILGSYVLANVYCAVRITLRERDARYLFAMPIVFAVRHIGYGLGSIWGLLKGSVSKQFWRNCLTLTMFRQKTMNAVLPLSERQDEKI